MFYVLLVNWFPSISVFIFSFINFRLTKKCCIYVVNARGAKMESCKCNGFYINSSASPNGFPLIFVFAL